MTMNFDFNFDVNFNDFVYRVWQKISNPLKFFAVFSAVAWNFKAKFYRHI